MTKHILHALTDTNIGGAGIQVYQLLKALDGYRKTVFLPETSALAPYMADAGAEVFFMPSKDNFFSLLEHIREIAPDIVHTHANFRVRAAASLAGVPLTISTKHCAVGGIKNAFLYRAVTDFTVATSESAKAQLLADGIPEKEIVLIENRTTLTKPTAEERLKSRKAFGVAQKDFVVGLCGRLEPIKGQKVLLLALCYALKQNPKIRVLFLGVGSDREMLRREALSLGIADRVTFLGFMPDPRQFYTALDCHVSASLGSETSSLALSEGMSMGLPTLASAVEGNATLVKNGGVLFPIGDARLLGSCILRLSLDRLLWRKMAYHACRRSEELGGTKRMAQAYDALYQVPFRKRLAKKS